MLREEKELIQYEAPTIVEYGDISTITAEANANQSGVDSQYFLGFNGVCGDLAS